MIDEILSNISFLSDKDILNIKDKLSYDVKKYINEEYNKLLENWQKEYPLFNIPSGIVSISINNQTKHIPFGKNKYTKDTIFDLASMSKLYTEYILFDVIKDYNLSLENKIGDITKLYSKISDLSLMDLISFNNTYKTDFDMRLCNNKKDALDALRTSYIEREKTGKFCYTDIPIMILTDILEEYTNMSYYELFDKYIIKKYNLKDTYLLLPDGKEYVTINESMVNDPKANIFGGYHGHAGVKASPSDFIKFLNTFYQTDYDKELFHTHSNAVDNKNGEVKLNKALIGNINLVVPKELNEKHLCLASNNLPKKGISIQGSTRCQGETCIFNVNNKEYVVSVCIFIDLYTQLDNAIKYEKTNDKKITSEYIVKNKKYYMVDIRDILTYKGIYKDMLDVIGISRIIELNRLFINK